MRHVPHFALEERPDGNWKLHLPQQPANCHGLESAPPEMEEPLRSGWWFVMLAAVWSGPDLAAIRTAIAVAQELTGQVQVAVRPFVAHTEMQSWLPSLKADAVSPIWVLLHEGELVDWKFGNRPQPYLVEWVTRCQASASELADSSD